MTYDRTNLKARFFDRERARKGPEGSLILLKYRSKDAEGVIAYDTVKEYPNSWRLNTIKGPDGAFYTVYEVADVDGSLQTIMDSEPSAITDYVVEGRVYELDLEKLTRPMVAPKIITLQGRDKNELYEH